MHVVLRSWSRSMLLVVGLAVGCTGSRDEAAEPAAEPPTAATSEIVGGRSDRGRDPAVVALLIGDDALCTGSLVAPDTVLTARHCVSITVEQVDCGSKEAQIKSDRDPASMTVLVGDDIETAQPVARGAALIVPTGKTLCAHDIALLKLDRPVHGVTPLPVAATLGDASGRLLRAVGFGQRADDGPAGRKYARAHVPVQESTDHELLVGEVSCHGDSGGPAIDEATRRVVGVLSRGGPGCEGPETHNIYTRPGAFARLLQRAGVAVDGG